MDSETETTGIEFHETKLMSAIEIANAQLENTNDEYEREQIFTRLDSLESELNELHNSRTI